MRVAETNCRVVASRRGASGGAMVGMVEGLRPCEVRDARFSFGACEAR